MPCYITDDEKNYYANLKAREYLEKINILVPTRRFANEILCEILQTWTLDKIKEEGLEEWYINHLSKDGENNPSKMITEILRLYK